MGSTTFIYKQACGCDIPAEVWDPQPAAKNKPVLCWVHGGALVSGSRMGVNPQLMDAALAAGAVVVSIDYRLCPETLLPELVADVVDAFAWIRAEGPALFGADGENIIAAGSSAGGYLCLTLGYLVQPPIRGVISFYGYGDLVTAEMGDPAFTWVGASPYPRHAGAPGDTWEQALAEVSGPPITDSSERESFGGWYRWTRRHGTWTIGVSGGWDPKTEPEKFRPYMAEANIGSAFPPTILVGLLLFLVPPSCLLPYTSLPFVLPPSPTCPPALSSLLLPCSFPELATTLFPR